jgi:hypothetical protein
MEEGIFQRGEKYLNKEDNAPKARRSTFAIHQLIYWQVLGCLEPAGSYPCPQQPINGPYSESDESNPHSHTIYLRSKIYFNIILPAIPRSLEWFSSFTLSAQNFVHISKLPFVCYIRT